jgi:dihydroxy-acid dehydratase
MCGLSVGGPCGGQFTANTMACVAEAIGLALPHSAGAPAPYEIRDRIRCGQRQGGDGTARPQHPAARHRHPQGASRMRPPSWPRLGGSTNAGCICRPWRHECGIEFDLFDVCRDLQARRPISPTSSRAGAMSPRTYVRGRRRAACVIKALLDGGFLHGDCMTVTGRTMAENLERRWNSRAGCDLPGRQSALHHRWRGWPEGQSGARGRDRQSGGHEDAEVLGPGALFRLARKPASQAVDREYEEGDVLVIRYEGPKGGPGMREMLSTTGRSTARAWATRLR